MADTIQLASSLTGSSASPSTLLPTNRASRGTIHFANEGTAATNAQVSVEGRMKNSTVWAKIPPCGVTSFTALVIPYAAGAVTAGGVTGLALEFPLMDEMRVVVAGATPINAGPISAYLRFADT
jgi:hypothetical protein